MLLLKVRLKTAQIAPQRKRGQEREVRAEVERPEVMEAARIGQKATQKIEQGPGARAEVEQQEIPEATRIPQRKITHEIVQREMPQATQIGKKEEGVKPELQQYKIIPKIGQVEIHKMKVQRTAQIVPRGQGEAGA